MGAVRKITKMPRRAANTVVVASTSAFDTALKGVYSSLRRLTKGTRRLSKTALFINGKKGRKSRKRGKRAHTRKRRHRRRR